MLKKINDFLYRVLGYILVVLLSAMVAIIFLQVVYRIKKGALTWSEESARYIMIYLTFIGAALAVRDKSLISVEAVMVKLPPKIRHIINIIVEIVTEIVFFIMIYYGFRLFKLTMTQISPVLKIPMGYIYFAIVLGFFLMAVFNLENIGELFKNRQEVEDGK